MSIDAHRLAKHYSSKSDDELDALHASGVLTDTAYSAIEAEMFRRGRVVPERPIEPRLKQPALDPTTKWQRESILIWAACMLVWWTAVPLLNMKPIVGSPALSMLISIAPIFFLIRGVQALMHPEIASRYPEAVLLGVIATVPFLSIAPISIRLALEAWPTHRSWIVLSLAGLVVSLAYLWRAVRYWLDRSRLRGQA